MMNIEDLKKQRESILQQRDNAFSAYYQTLGALALLDHFLETMGASEKDESSQPQVAFENAANAAQSMEANSQVRP